MNMKNLSRSRRLKIVLGAIVSIVLVVWALSGTDWATVGRELRGVQYWVFIPLTLGMVLHYALRALRWHFLLPPGERRLRQMFDSILVGNFATFVLPLRAGEFIRPFLFSRYSGRSFSTCLVSVVVERFFDLSIVLFSFAIILPNVPTMPPWVSVGAQALTVMAVCIFVLMLVGTFFPEPVLRLGKAILSPFPQKLSKPLLKFGEDFLHGAGVLRSGGRLAYVFVLSFAVWIEGFFLYHMYFWLFSMHPSPWLSVSSAVILALAVAAPSAPGFIGVYQFAVVASFALFGLSQEQGVAFALLTHAYQYVLFVLYGMYVLVRDGLHLSQLREQEEVAEEALP